MEDRQVQPGRRGSARLLAMLALALAASAAWSDGARALGMVEATGGMYQATVIVTGTDMRMRPYGFAESLRQVLVKLSGEPRLRDDPRVAQLAAHPDALVASFSYVDQMAGEPIHDDQGTYDRSYNLTVHFDPERIDKVLADLGQKPWRDARPVVMPVLSVRGFKAPYLLSAESVAGADQRKAFVDVARDYGMSVRFPSEAQLAAWGVTVGKFPSPQGEDLSEQAVVAGTLEFEESLPGWVGAWKMRWHGVDYNWGVRGVNYDNAFHALMRGVLRIVSGHGAPG